MDVSNPQEVMTKLTCAVCGKELGACVCAKKIEIIDPALDSKQQSTSAYDLRPEPRRVTAENLSMPVTGHTAPENYVFEKTLSESARSNVFDARHKSTSKFFAVKLLKTEPIADRTQQRKLQQEGKALSALTHPNIGTVYEFGVTADNRPYVARDLVEGEDLGAVFDSEGSLDKQRFADIFRQVCDALSYAHQQNVLHLHLNPSNIIVNKRSDMHSPFVKVVDFGVSKLISTNSNTAHNPAGSSNPRYLSPEQCSGNPATAASDIYSLGCIMYEAIAGHPPFYEGEALEIACKQTSVKPPHLTAVTGQPVDVRLESLIMRCLAKEPVFRPRSADEIEAELKQIATTEPPVPGVVPPEDLKAQEKNGRNLAIVLIACVLITCFGAWAYKNMAPPSVVPASMLPWKQAYNAAMEHQKTGNHELVEQYLKDALRKAEELPVSDAELAPILSKLGSFYYSRGRLRDAAPYLMRALPIYEKLQGDLGKDVQWVAEDLADIAQNTENWSVAVQMNKKLEPIKMSRFGRNSAQYAQLLASLGGDYVHMHDYNQAQKVLKRSLAIKKLDGTPYFAPPRTMLNLAYCLDCQGKAKEAEEYYLQAIKKAEAERAQDKLELAATLDYYANFLMRTGRESQAATYVKRARQLKSSPVAEHIMPVEKAAPTKTERAEATAARAIHAAGEAKEKAVRVKEKAGRLLEKARGWRDKFRQ